MEFPDLGANCAEKSCNRFDFLPVKCDGCGKIFCAQHYSYLQHGCPTAHDVQVPVCPLCGDPVPTPRNVSPDQTVGEHIDRYCKSERKQIFTNRCSFKNCKKKELIPVQCSICKMNFCLRHRHSADHECKGPKDTQRSLTAQAAESRKARPNGLFTNTTKPKTKNITESVQGNMTEDEALARALALSIMELDESADRNRRNQQRVPAVGSAATATTATTSSIANKDKCQLS